MNAEGRKKEMEGAALISRLMQTVRGIPPRDAGNGWIETVLPNHPMFKDCHNYQKPIPPGFLICMVQKRVNLDDAALFPNGRWHLSISHNMMERHPGSRMNAPGRLPTWDELKEVRYKFLPPEVNAALMFPPKSMYYSFHDTCLHLIEIPPNVEGINGMMISPEQLPKWDEIKAYRYAHFPPETNMAFLFPPREQDACRRLVEIPANFALDPNQKGGL